MFFLIVAGLGGGGILFMCFSPPNRNVSMIRAIPEDFSEKPLYKMPYTIAAKILTEFIHNKFCNVT